MSSLALVLLSLSVPLLLPTLSAPPINAMLFLPSEAPPGSTALGMIVVDPRIPGERVAIVITVNGETVENTSLVLQSQPISVAFRFKVGSRGATVVTEIVENLSVAGTPSQIVKTVLKGFVEPSSSDVVVYTLPRGTVPLLGARNLPVTIVAAARLYALVTITIDAEGGTVSAHSFENVPVYPGAPAVMHVDASVTSGELTLSLRAAARPVGGLRPLSVAVAGNLTVKRFELVAATAEIGRGVLTLSVVTKPGGLGALATVMVSSARGPALVLARVQGSAVLPLPAGASTVVAALSFPTVAGSPIAIVAPGRSGAQLVTVVAAPRVLTAWRGFEPSSMIVVQGWGGALLRLSICVNGTCAPVIGAGAGKGSWNLSGLQLTLVSNSTAPASFYARFEAKPERSPTRRELFVVEARALMRTALGSVVAAARTEIVVVPRPGPPKTAVYLGLALSVLGLLVAALRANAEALYGVPLRLCVFSLVRAAAIVVGVAVLTANWFRVLSALGYASLIPWLLAQIGGRAGIALSSVKSMLNYSLALQIAGTMMSLGAASSLAFESALGLMATGIELLGRALQGVGGAIESFAINLGFQWLVPTLYSVVKLVETLVAAAWILAPVLMGLAVLGLGLASLEPARGVGASIFSLSVVLQFAFPTLLAVGYRAIEGLGLSPQAIAGVVEAMGCSPVLTGVPPTVVLAQALNPFGLLTGLGGVPSPGSLVAAQMYVLSTAFAADIAVIALTAGICAYLATLLANWVSRSDVGGYLSSRLLAFLVPAI